MRRRRRRKKEIEIIKFFVTKPKKILSFEGSKVDTRRSSYFGFKENSSGTVNNTIVLTQNEIRKNNFIYSMTVIYSRVTSLSILLWSREYITVILYTNIR